MGKTGGRGRGSKATHGRKSLSLKTRTNDLFTRPSPLIKSWEHWVQLAREAKTKGLLVSLHLLLQLCKRHREGQLICLTRWHYVKRKSMIYPLLQSSFGHLRSATAGASVCAYAEARGGYQASCSIIFHHSFPRQGLSLHLELGCWLASPSDPPVSAPHSARFTSVPSYTSVLHELQGFELSPLWLCSICS